MIMLRKRHKKPTNFDADLAIIGSGSAGMEAALLGAKHGMQVALIEGGQLGGSTPHNSCIPSNAWLLSARFLRSVHQSSHGINIEGVHADWNRIARFKDACVKQALSLKSQQRLTDAGIKLYQEGFARFVNPWTLVINRKKFSARHFIIASGCRQDIPQIIGLKQDMYVTCRHALTFSRQPTSVCILGAGRSGLILAEILNALGTRVHLVDSAPNVLNDEDVDVGQAIVKNLSEKGVKISLSSSVQTVKDLGEQREINVKEPEDNKRLLVDRFILATGMHAQTGIGFN